MEVSSCQASLDSHTEAGEVEGAAVRRVQTVLTECARRSKFRSLPRKEAALVSRRARARIRGHRERAVVLDRSDVDLLNVFEEERTERDESAI